MHFDPRMAVNKTAQPGKLKISFGLLCQFLIWRGHVVQYVVLRNYFTQKLGGEGTAVNRN